MNYNKSVFILKSSIFCFIMVLIYPVNSYSEDNGIIPVYATNPNHIISQVINNGADKVVEELTKNQKTWFYVLRQISKGGNEWIRVAAFLLPGTDAGNRTLLTDTVNYAIENSPEEVLSIAIPVFHIYEVCGCGPADADTDEKNIKSKIQSLMSVKDPNLIPIRDACIAQLNKCIKGDVHK